MRDWLSHRVVASPDAPALVRAEDGETWTYAGLDQQVDRTARRLAALGIEPGDHVGVLLPPCVGYVGLVHATMRLGATLVPLGDRLTHRELSDRIERADVTTIICGAETEPDAVAVADDVPVVSVDEPVHVSVAELHAAEPTPFEPAEWGVDDRLCILFTSGTSGDPKPVELLLGNVLASAIGSAFRLGVDPDDRWLVTLSLHHMGGLAPIYRSTLYGTTVVLRESFDPGGAADDIDRHDVTGVSLVPTMLKRMLDRRGTLADSLRFVLVGGAPASESLIERCRSFSVPVHPTYGMTETASQIATARPQKAFRRPETVGRPLFWTDVTVVDDAGEPVARGETGELVVSGPTVSPGYYADPDATRERYADRGLRTGDVGYRDEAGYVYVLNRRDDRIITGGENVDPGEIVDVLTDHPGVDAAAVVGLDDPEWGERVAAQVVRSDPDLGGNELLEFARDGLAGFKLPRTVAFAEGLPRTVSGTVDREAVAEHLREHGFEPERPPARESGANDRSVAQVEAGERNGTADSESAESPADSDENVADGDPDRVFDGAEPETSDDSSAGETNADGGEPTDLYDDAGQ